MFYWKQHCNTALKKNMGLAVSVCCFAHYTIEQIVLVASGMSNRGKNGKDKFLHKWLFVLTHFHLSTLL